MPRRQNLIDAIERYDDWGRPWAFFDAVASDGSLDDADRREWAIVWAAVCDERLWTSGSLGEATAQAEIAIASSMPWLSPRACRHLANAAGYQWR
ncbi:hypothetical protein IEQ11_02495 [Lysobacter capsici]|uniref:hypothetical protein n=1 Tax=Lysobacter capsici TaxID=435897 RepID=UPI00177F6AB0|nr:hypothetical protein [Lysobacter capsici]UOF15553.1 hypothetical protein IEQ11_02495 [Lysobacter capsici]